jgi:hypothetical protein
MEILDLLEEAQPGEVQAQTLALEKERRWEELRKSCAKKIGNSAIRGSTQKRKRASFNSANGSCGSSRRSATWKSTSANIRARKRKALRRIN